VLTKALGSSQGQSYLVRYRNASQGVTAGGVHSNHHPPAGPFPFTRSVSAQKRTRSPTLSLLDSQILRQNSSPSALFHFDSCTGMDDKDRITASPSSHRTANTTIRIVDDGHEPTAATLETIASAQGKNRKVSGDTPQEHPPILRKEAPLQRKPGSPKFEMPPSATATSATTQRTGVPPLKAPTSSPKKKRFRTQGESKSTSSLRTPSKSPPSSNPPSASLQVGQRIPSSSTAKEYSALLPPRPRPGHSPRSSSQDGKFFDKVGKGKEKVHSSSLKAAGFINKVSHVAWDKLKSPRLSKSGGPGRSSSPQHGHKDKNENRDTSNDIDVFNMDLKEAVRRTRIVSDRKMGGDAAYWIPAIAYRCLQYAVRHIFLTLLMC
jgi:hypothetical protein